jgi:cytochrome c oxidase subunit 2
MTHSTRHLRGVLGAAGLAGILLLAGCDGPQSALDPAGRDAERIARLTLWMAAGALAIWAGVLGLALYAPRAAPAGATRAHTLLIIGGGVVFPFLVLTLLLVYGLAELPRILAPAPPGTLSIDVTGSQWWWRVRYVVPGRAPVELANEIRLPAGRRVNVRLASADVVHSFWVPSIAGKMDLIPGRVNRLALEPTRTGTFRGACAEFCGTSHARMNFVVVVTDGPAFDAWLAAQARPAPPPADGVPARGLQTFFARGCSNCHTIRGTAAAGVSGPDLTHVGGRETIAAGVLPTSPDALRRWVSATELLKPGAHMPAFAHLPEEDLTSLAAYLASLQ